MKYFRILFFQRKSTIIKLCSLLLLISIIFSNSVYQSFSHRYQVTPNSFTWLIILFQDITTGIYLLPIIYSSMLLFCLEAFTRDTVVSLRFFSLKHKHYFLLKYSLLLPFLFLSFLLLLSLVMGLLNGFSFSISSVIQPILSEIYEVNHISSYRSLFLILFCFLSYLLFLSEMTVFLFLFFKKRNIVIATLFSFLVIQSVFWLYPINLSVNQFFPIHHYILKAEKYGVEIIYWLSLLSICFLLNVYKIRSTKWEE